MLAIAAAAAAAMAASLFAAFEKCYVYLYRNSEINHLLFQKWAKLFEIIENEGKKTIRNLLANNLMAIEKLRDSRFSCAKRPSVHNTHNTPKLYTRFVNRIYTFGRFCCCFFHLIPWPRQRQMNEKKCIRWNTYTRIRVTQEKLSTFEK